MTKLSKSRTTVKLCAKTRKVNLRTGVRAGAVPVNTQSGRQASEQVTLFDY